MSSQNLALSDTVLLAMTALLATLLIIHLQEVTGDQQTNRQGAEGWSHRRWHWRTSLLLPQTGTSLPHRVCKSCDHFVQVTFVAKDTISSHDTEPVWLLHHGGGKITITLHFQGHYNEPDVNINFSSVRGQSQLSITLNHILLQPVLLQVTVRSTSWSTHLTLGNGMLLKSLVNI